jgi:hypothetical protein
MDERGMLGIDPSREPELAELMLDYATPTWLKQVAAITASRDPIDAAAAIEVLSTALSRRADRLLGRLAQ